MSTKTIGIIAGIIVIGGAVYMFQNSGSDATAPTDEEEAGEMQTNGNEVTDVSSSGQAAFADLLSLGGSARCELSYNEQQSGTEVNGVFYVTDQGNRFRGDFTMTQDGTPFESHIIREGTTAYTWSQSPSGMMGIRMEVNDQEDFDKAENVDMDQRVDYSCTSWSVDESMFVPPSDVNFTDISSFQSGQGSSDDMRSAQCAACGQITDSSSREQCLASLGC